VRRPQRIGGAIAIAARLAAALLAPPAPAAAQTATPAETCAYDACALRLWENDLLEGREGERVAAFGFFRPPAARELLEASDSAAWHLDRVEETYTSGRVIWILGQAASLAGLVMYFSPDPAVQKGGFAAQTAGFLVTSLGQRRVTTAKEAMSRAVWWYNRDVAAGRAPRDR
jgi:hypothetical protein